MVDGRGEKIYLRSTREDERIEEHRRNMVAMAATGLLLRGNGSRKILQSIIIITGPISFNISFNSVGINWTEIRIFFAHNRIVLLFQATMTNTIFFHLENLRSSWKIWIFLLSIFQQIVRFIERGGEKSYK